MEAMLDQAPDSDTPTPARVLVPSATQVILPAVPSSLSTHVPSEPYIIKNKLAHSESV